ncbi:MAG: RNase H1/viroplasmin domain-containing protein [Gammaproteobacteria bacterium]|nr:RNase H1/viroplasmin domain-containing protein [Gammaproteobacteria bacterium]
MNELLNALELIELTETPWETLMEQLKDGLIPTPILVDGMPYWKASELQEHADQHVRNISDKGAFYVVWIGYKPGVYADWEVTKKQTEGYPNAKFKKFTRRTEAEQAFHKGHRKYRTY